MTSGTFVNITPVPCQHIADWYQRQWEARPCLASNLLRWGYKGWASGRVAVPMNNLYREWETT